MAKRIACSGCGEMRWLTAGKTEVLCRPCRSKRIPSHGAKGYGRGCRCEICREAKRVEVADYRLRRKERTGLAQGRRASRTYVTPNIIQTCATCGLPMFGNVRSASPQHNSCRPERYWANMIRISRSDRIAIYERDGWACKICGDPVDHSLPPNHRMAPTLDHIIPRALCLFPDDSVQNLRLAHRACNSARGIKAA